MRRVGLMLVLLLSACARVSVVRIAEPGDTTTEGIRYYRPRPYLLVSEAPGDKGGERVEFKVVYLPDFAQEYAVQVRAGFGVVDFKPTLENGWNLVAVDAKVDSRTKDVIDAATGVVSKAAGLARGAPVVTPGLYRLVIDDAPLREDGAANPAFGSIVGIEMAVPATGR